MSKEKWAQHIKEINESYNKIGKPGEDRFSEIVELIYPEITGVSREFILTHPNCIKITNISKLRRQHDFFIEHPLWINGQWQGIGVTKVEVKARSAHLNKNVFIETWLKPIDETDDGKKGWYYTSDTDWYVFMHMIDDKSQAQATLIKADVLKELVIAGIEKRKYQEITRIDSKGYLVPITDLWQHGGKPVYEGIKKSIDELNNILLPISQPCEGVMIDISSLVDKSYLLQNGMLKGMYIEPRRPESISFIAESTK